jgi:RNA processing factor Prp31
MNKIVDELVAQVATDSSGKWVAVADLPEFVQLIVEECASIVEDAVDHREPASTYVDKINQHFGVEE